MISFPRTRIERSFCKSFAPEIPNSHPSKTAKGGAASAGWRKGWASPPTPRSTTEPHRGWMSDTYLLHLHAEGEKCFLLTSPFIEPARNHAGNVISFR